MRALPPLRQAYCVPAGEPIAPFDDPTGKVQILARDLEQLQREALGECGLVWADKPPSGPHLVFSSRTWFTPAALQRLLAALSPGQRLRIESEAFWELSGALQRLDAPGVYELGISPGGPTAFADLEPVTVDFEFTLTEPDKQHPAMAHAMPKAVPASDACVHQLDHWSHILRVNWLAMATTIERERRGFERAGLLSKAGKIAGVLWKARGVSRDKLARGLSQIGADCQIHPTAVVEASKLGPGCVVGPFAVVRGAVLGPGVQIEEHAICNASVVGEGARVGRRAMVNLCVLYPGAMVSNGRGHQASVFGRDSFCAETVMIYDLSFSGEVKVWDGSERVSSGTHFLGAAIGHDARLGAEVILGYGSHVPNGAFVVGPAHNVLRAWGGGEGPHRVEDGVAVSVRSGRTPPPEKE